jgi:hypothetical protein
MGVYPGISFCDNAFPMLRKGDILKYCVGVLAPLSLSFTAQETGRRPDPSGNFSTQFFIHREIS